jgi:hypothetical protein
LYNEKFRNYGDKYQKNKDVIQYKQIDKDNKITNGDQLVSPVKNHQLLSNSKTNINSQVQ